MSELSNFLVSPSNFGQMAPTIDERQKRFDEMKRQSREELGGYFGSGIEYLGIVCNVGIRVG